MISLFATPAPGGGGGGSFTAAGDLAGDGTSQTVIGVTGTSGTAAIHATNLLWDTGVTFPTIYQANKTSGNGTQLTIQAQNATGGSSTGGQLCLTSGSGTSAHGTVVVQTGGTDRMVVSTTSVALAVASLIFDLSVTSPTIKPVDRSSGTAQALTIAAQSTSAASGTGGNLNLFGGAGTGGSGVGGSVNVYARAGLAASGLVNIGVDSAYLVVGNIWSGGGGLQLNDVGAAPGTSPGSGSVFIFVDSNVLKWKDNGGTVYDLSASGGGVTGLTGGSSLEMSVANLFWDQGVSSPALFQEDKTSGNGGNLIVRAQNASGTNTGGNLDLMSGGAVGAGTPGVVRAYASGVNGGGATLLATFATAGLSMGAIPIKLGAGTQPSVGKLRFESYDAAGTVLISAYANSADLPILTHSSAGILSFGGAACWGMDFTVLNSAVSFKTSGGIPVLSISTLVPGSGGYAVSLQPCAGQGAWGYPWGGLRFEPYAVPDSNHTVAGTNGFECPCLKLTGTLTAGRELTFPAYKSTMFWLWNTTGQTLTIKPGTDTLANNKMAVFQHDGSVYFRWVLDT